LNIYLETGDKKGECMTLFGLGLIYRGRKNYSKAFDSLNRAIKIAEELASKFLLCAFFNIKAELLFKTGNLQEAQILNEKALTLSEETKRQKIVFNCLILKHKINSDTVSMRGMLNDEKYNDEQRAEINFEIWKIDQDPEAKQKALEIYKKLYLRTPEFEFKEKIEEMENFKS